MIKLVMRDELLYSTLCKEHPTYTVSAMQRTPHLYS